MRLDRRPGGVLVIRWLAGHSLRRGAVRSRGTCTANQALSNREVAQALFVTPRTVERHLYTAYKKLGINSRGELAQALAGQGEEQSTL